MLILIHSSKTMRDPESYDSRGVQQPALLDQSEILITKIKKFSLDMIQKSMALSTPKARETYNLIQNYSPSGRTLPAINIFQGDIYSGLQVNEFTDEDNQYANDHLLILSGLYGVLRPFDEVRRYRLEMGYTFLGLNLYDFWGDKIAKQLPKKQDIINLSAVEYTKAVLPYITGTKKITAIDGHEHTKIITPKFLTISPKTGEPTFVTVHAKIARGAFARWLIQNRIKDISRLKDFKEIGYKYDARLSSQTEPVFVAAEFKGLGLSIRLKK